jgi:hypothetical protein
MLTLKKTTPIVVSILIAIILYYFLFAPDSRPLSEHQYQTSSIQEEVDYKKCIKKQSKNIHRVDGYGIQFLGICSNTPFLHLCKDNKYFCGLAPDRGQEHYPNYGVMMIVKDQDGKIILKGVSNNLNSDLKLLNVNEEKFNSIVMLVDQPSGFPYLVLKDVMERGYQYHLYSTKNEFKKVAEIGPTSTGFYKNKNGDYLIDVQHSYLPPSGGMADQIWYSIPYKLIKDHFEIDSDLQKKSNTVL